MNVGLDFDNTIASYDALFIFVASKLGIVPEDSKLNKTQLRDFIKDSSGGDKLWMKVQGQVYGKYMHRAQLMPGVRNFLLRCKLRSIDVCIVSHKTEYGHFDNERVPLRGEAINWMKRLGFFNNQYMPLRVDDVYFAETRHEKVKKIKELGCDFFVDDLIEVFKEKDFPESVEKILFHNEFEQGLISYDNWLDIDNHIIGKETDNDIKNIVNFMLNNNPDSIERVEGQGNSQVYKLKINNSIYALKRYPDRFNDTRPRLETEYHALNFLHDNSITNLPKPEARNDDLNIAIYSWVDGNPINSITDQHIDGCIEFIVSLKILSEKDNLVFSCNASEACLSLEELINQIQDRLDSFMRNNSEKELLDFLKNKFQPKLTTLLNTLYKKNTLGFIKNILHKDFQILSPSDFGLHNSLIKSKGEINFLDFDYFGWDDPVKLTADFYWHPAMKLSITQKEKWLQQIKDIFSMTDIHFEERLRVSLPLYGLRWILILLNEFNLNRRKRRSHAKFNEIFDWEKKKEEQLCKAITLFSLIHAMEVC